MSDRNPICPKCKGEAIPARTRYGIRHSCCGLHSWDGKPLVSQEVHDARKRFHAAFDPIWKRGEDAYDMGLKTPGSHGWEKEARRFRRTIRNRAYHYLAAKSGLDERECHGATQTDLGTLHIITEIAKSISGPSEVRDWWKSQRHDND